MINFFSKIARQGVEISRNLSKTICIADFFIRLFFIIFFSVQILLYFYNNFWGESISFVDLPFLGENLVFLLKFHPIKLFLATLFFSYLYFNMVFRILNYQSDILFLKKAINDLDVKFSSRVKDTIDEELNFLMIKHYNESGEQINSHFFEKIEKGHYLITEYSNIDGTFKALHARTNENFNKYGYNQTYLNDRKLNKIHIWGNDLKLTQEERANWIVNEGLIVPKNG